MTNDSLIEKLIAYRIRLKGRSQKRIADECITIAMGDASTSTKEGVTSPASIAQYAKENGFSKTPEAQYEEEKRREISVVTEEEFVGLYANKTWARSTFKFLEREGIKLTKTPLKPVSVSLEKCTDALEYFLPQPPLYCDPPNRKFYTDNKIKAAKAVLDSLKAQGVEINYVD